MVSCDSTSTSVFDRNGSRVGRVDVISSTEAEIFNAFGSQIGRVDQDDVFDQSNNRKGRVTSSNRILDASSNFKGRIRGEDCLDRDDDIVGSLTSDIDDEAAGGACLLLLLN